jgi:hypothetical protein
MGGDGGRPDDLPVCLTPEEQQAIDEEAISLTEQIKRGKYEWLR